MIGSFVFLNPPSRRSKTGGSKMAYRRRTRRRGTTAGQVRKTARRAFKRNTTKGQKRKTARRAYRRRNPSNPRGARTKAVRKRTVDIKGYTRAGYWR